MVMTETEKRTNSKALSAGWICFLIGVAIMLFIHTGILFSGPFFLTAFILSIVVITKNRIAAGVVLLLASLIVPPAIFLGTVALTYQTNMMKLESEQLQKEAALRSIVFEDLKGDRSRSIMEVEGKVRNNGHKQVEYVKVGVEWLGKYDKIVDSDWTYAVSGLDRAAQNRSGCLPGSITVP